MPDRGDIRDLMPLMREFGSLARKRVGHGVTPLEYQRWLDLKARIGQRFGRSEAPGPDDESRAGDEGTPTRLLVDYPSRAVLVDAVLENVQPVGLLVRTPFAADVGTRFLVCLHIELEGEDAEFPAEVVTSIAQGSHTLSTTSMGMSLKLLRTNPVQRAGLSKLFDHALDERLGWKD